MGSGGRIQGRCTYSGGGRTEIQVTCKITFMLSLADASSNASNPAARGSLRDISAPNPAAPPLRRSIAGRNRPQREPTIFTSLTTTCEQSSVVVPWWVDLSTTVPLGFTTSNAVVSPEGDPVASIATSNRPLYS